MFRTTFVVALWLAAIPLAAQDPKIGETRPNVRVLKDLRESELFLAMNFLADSLGVHCDHCHVKSGAKWMWADDAKPAKAKGLQMIAMVQSLNASQFGGTSRVTCYTCHRGSLEPARIVPLPPIPSEERTGQRPVETLPAAREVITRYLAAVGAVKAGHVHVAGAIERTEGRHETFALWIRGDENAEMKSTTADGVVERTLDGKTATIRANDKVIAVPPESYARFKRSFAMYAPVKVTESAEQMKVTGTDVIDGRKTYAVHVDAGPGVTRKLFFDATSGLLLREITIRETAFVPLLEQIDFSDYREVAGMKMPLVLRTSDSAPYDTATRRITKVQ